MKFSMIFEAQLEDGTAERERATIQDCVDQAVFAEKMGFDGVWAVEHHSLVEYSHMPAPEIFLTAVPEGDGVRVSVRDSGPGVPAALMTKIFDPFFTTKDVGEGTGLGLAISQRIVRSHGGRIELGPSEPGRGAEFIVWLPLVPPAELPPRDPPKDPAA